MTLKIVDLVSLFLCFILYNTIVVEQTAFELQKEYLIIF
jgi:hypothetical protein